MPCLICGDICRCSSTSESSAPPRWLPEPEVPSAAVSDRPTAEVTVVTDEVELADRAPLISDANEPAPDDTAWRREVAARLNRYQSRRKPRPPRYPSLRLHFEREADRAVGGGGSEFSYSPQANNHALAYDEMATNRSIAGSDLAPSLDAEFSVQSSVPSSELSHHEAPTPIAFAAPASAKIIEFPRSWAPPITPLDELAEPVITSPRILDVPEAVPSPPALGGITIERIELPAPEKRPGIDIPLQTAPRGRRLLAAFVDFIFIAAACALFAFTFWKLTAVRPPQIQILGVLAGMVAVFWSAYQYLLIIYAGTTPGLRLARLELSRFDGRPASRRLRRWRVLASFLSVAALGMGYSWALLDEDSLCWHDRITHTYLARRSERRSATPAAQDSPS